MDTHPPAPLPAPSRAHGSGSGSGDSRGAGRGPMAKRVTREAEMPVREYQAELGYIVRVSPVLHRIKVGFVPGMRVPGLLVLNDSLKALVLTELERYCTDPSAVFLPACKQVANVAALPGIVGHSVALPDAHSGYGFSIGNVAAFDMADPESVVVPGGIGFDINCGVRLVRTNLMEADLRRVVDASSGERVQDRLAQAIFDHIPVGVGKIGMIRIDAARLDEILELGVDWALREGYAWQEDKEHCEENGRMLEANPGKVSARAKKRGLPQVGTLGAGNHYCEVQIVDQVFDAAAAETMGIDRIGQVVVMIHCGSRGLGHQVASDALVAMERHMAQEGLVVNDRQLACARIRSSAGQDYLAAMAAAANYAWVNRQLITFLVRQAFAKVFGRLPADLDMHVVYDTSHNIAKVERHLVGGETKTLLVHRKGSTRAFPPHHPLIPAEYQLIGQPAIIGGSMGSASYVLTGTEAGMALTFGSTCHGAGRAMSRSRSRRTLDPAAIFSKLKALGISLRIGSPKLITEEADESYKDIDAVVETCEAAQITRRVVRLRPVCVIKG